MGSVTPQPEEWPPRASLHKDVYRPFPRLPPNLPPASETDAPALLRDALANLAGALGGGGAGGDAARVAACFLRGQAYWRDLLALTWHIRTLRDAPAIAPALLELAGRRGCAAAGFVLDEDSVHDAEVSPALRWVEGLFTFETTSPAAACGGRVMLFPEADEGGAVVWRIWVLSTWVDDLKGSPEDVGLLRAPGRMLQDEAVVETDVLLLGGGNAGIILAARLKALGVDSVIVDKNPQPGDNWALRYDCLRFHIGRHSCETPYLPYPSHLPVILEKKDLSDHMKNYAEAFHLNILNSSVLEGSSFNRTRGMWTFKVRTPSGTKTVKSKHLVQCTGIGSSKPYVPSLPGEYQGINIHSAEYKNAKKLIERGAKSVIVVGSANSAFDVMEDCAETGLATTMVARSPTYIFPWEYALAPSGLGLYERLPAALVDKLQMSGPAAVGGQLVRGSYAAMAEAHPDRYAPLAAAGFPVYDSVGGKGDLVQHIMERMGGHFNDIGEGVRFIVEGRVAVRGNVEPVAYTPSGLRFSDGSTVDADAVVWCTGFRDGDRSVTVEILGGETFVDGEGGGGGQEEEILGPRDVAARRDAIWAVDEEGELRGVFKRNLKVENYWVLGGGTSHHRYYSWPIALQIKAALEGILPEAYRDTPGAS